MVAQMILPMPEILMNTACRFWMKVDKKSNSECWNWLGVSPDAIQNIIQRRTWTHVKGGV